MDNPFAGRVTPKEIDWPATGVTEWFAVESSRYTSIIYLLAKLLALRGLTMLEPAASLRESWKVIAVKLGVRIYRVWDWDDFWRKVAYIIVDDHTNPSATNLSKQVRTVMVQGNYAPFWHRSKYFMWASKSVEELLRFSQIISLVLARAAHDAEKNNIDRPSWFKELLALKEALDAARSPDGKAAPLFLKPTESGDGFSAGLSEDGDAHKIFVELDQTIGLVYLNGGGHTPNYIRTLALTLLEAADLADKST